jgi:hypothetical protein
MSVGVTMFFNLKSLPDATAAVRPVEFYVNNGRTTLSQQTRMVILCDSQTRPWIQELRNSLAPGVETVYVEKSLLEYDHYKLNHNIITENRRGNSNYTESRNTPSYCITTTLKFHAIKIAEQIFPDATHYFWIDFGCAHIAKEADVYLPKMLASPNPKVSCAYIHYRPVNEVEPMERYLHAGNPCSLAATIFSVEKSYVNALYTRAMSIFYEMLSKRVGHNEEAVLAYLYTRFPDMFHLYYGDYYSTASNYHYVVRDFHPIRWFFMENAIRNGRRDLAKTCAENILASIERGLFQLPDTDVAFLRSI